MKVPNLQLLKTKDTRTLLIAVGMGLVGVLIVRSVMKPPEQVEVMAAARDLDQGSVLERKDLAKVGVPRTNYSTKMYKTNEASMLDNKALVVDVPALQPILANYLDRPSQGPSLDTGERAVSIKFEDPGVNQLSGGDLIDILTTSGSGEGGVARVLLSGVYVLDRTGSDVTVRAYNLEEALLLKSAGRLSFALRNPEDREPGSTAFDTGPGNFLSRGEALNKAREKRLKEDDRLMHPQSKGGRRK